MQYIVEVVIAVRNHDSKQKSAVYFIFGTKKLRNRVVKWKEIKLIELI